ncbi:MAG: hypothetical protein ABL878_17370 [Burkholderiales bacterium]
MKQDELAHLLDVSPAMIVRMEQGAAPQLADIKTMLGLEVIFGRAPSEIFSALHAQVEEAVMGRAAALETVMSGPFSLVDWATRRALRDKNATCLANLTALLDRYDPHMLVLEDASQLPRRSARINRLYQAIAGLCHSRSIDLAIFSRTDIHRCYAMAGARTWQDIAEAVGRQLEPLRNMVPARRKAWQSEHRRMAIFAAAAVAMTYWQLADTPHRSGLSDLDS